MVSIYEVRASDAAFVVPSDSVILEMDEALNLPIYLRGDWTSSAGTPAPSVVTVLVVVVVDVVVAVGAAAAVVRSEETAVVAVPRHHRFLQQSLSREAAWQLAANALPS